MNEPCARPSSPFSRRRSASEEIEAVADDAALRLADERARAPPSSSGASPSTRARSTRSRSRRARRRCTSRSSPPASGPGDEVITSPDHLAGDRERRRSHRRAPGLLRRPRGRPEHRPGADRRGGDRAHPRGHAGRPRRPAVRPRPDHGARARARLAGGRGRRARGRERVPRPEGRGDRRRDLLLALRDEERRGRRGRDDHDRPRRPRRTRSASSASCAAGHGSLYDIRTAGFKANLADVNAAIALCQLDKIDAHRRDPAAPRRRLRRRGRRARRHRAARRATRATSTRSTSTSSASTPSSPARRATSTSRRSPPRTSARASTSSRAPADLLPRALPRPAAAAGRRAGRAPRCSRCRSRRRTRTRTSQDAIEALRRVHARLHGPMRRHSRGRPRIALKLAGSGAIIAYLVWQIDIGQTIDLIGELERPLPARRARHLPRDDLGDGLALAAPARVEGDPRAARLADEPLLRRLRGRAGAADLDRRRRRPDRRARAPAPGAPGRGRRRSRARAGASARPAR